MDALVDQAQLAEDAVDDPDARVEGEPPHPPGHHGGDRPRDEEDEPAEAPAVELLVEEQRDAEAEDQRGDDHHAREVHGCPQDGPEGRILAEVAPVLEPDELRVDPADVHLHVLGGEPHRVDDRIELEGDQEQEAGEDQRVSESDRPRGPVAARRPPGAVGDGRRSAQAVV